MMANNNTTNNTTNNISKEEELMMVNNNTIKNNSDNTEPTLEELENLNSSITDDMYDEMDSYSTDCEEEINDITNEDCTLDDEEDDEYEDDEDESDDSDSTADERLRMYKGDESDEYYEYNGYPVESNRDANENKKKEKDYLPGSFTLYMREMAEYDRISPERERELGRQIAEGGAAGKAARNELIKANLRLVIYCAKRYRGNNIAIEDLVQMGNIGLMKAVEKFDYTKGFRFSTYAMWWINQSLSRGIADNCRSIRIPVHMSERMRKVRSVEISIKQETGKDATIDQVVEATGMKKKDVLNTYRFMYSTVSLDSPISDDGESDLHDIVDDRNAITPEQSYIDKERHELVESILGMLSKREAKVLTYRFGLDGCDEMSLEEIGRLPEFSVSRERIRQIEAKAISKIRKSRRIRELFQEYMPGAC